MAIMIKHVRIKSFRSISDIDIELGMCNVLIGQNNCGKSNFVKAINIALNGTHNVSEDDIYIEDEEILSSDKTATIDILITPIDGEGKRLKAFPNFWTSVFTTEWITTDETKGDYVGIRTIISYDIRRSGYSITRKPITEWGKNIKESTCGRARNFGVDMLDYLKSYYMDAHRDISEDLNSKKSFISRAASTSELSEDITEKLERQLNDINEEIIKNIPYLNKTSNKIQEIGKTLGNKGDKVKIEPVARKMNDLHKGMDISLKESQGAPFSVSRHGQGTRSWISFLILGAYVDLTFEKEKDDDSEIENYVMLTMEEPEAHLHPQAQRQLYAQILEFNGQKIITTHSANILAQVDMKDIIHLYKEEGKTNVVRFNMEDYNTEDINKIKREVINTRGDLLFSKAIVLCEGITEEQALPIYFKEYFGLEPIYCGINIIGIGGQNYKTFLKLIKDLSIRWFIFSDGEPKTIRTVKNAIKVISNKDLGNVSNVFIIENNEDYERCLLSLGYGQMMIDGINKCENEIEIENENNNNTKETNMTYFKKYRKDNNHNKGKRIKSNKPKCKECGQDIYENEIKDYDGTEGYNDAIYDCCTKDGGKAKYASYIAEEIVANHKIPSKVKELFDEIAKQLNLEVRSEYSEN